MVTVVARLNTVFCPGGLMPNTKADAPLIFEGTVKSLAVSNVSAVSGGQ
jgi:hypothetical protein